MNFFDYDSPLYRFIRLLSDSLIISMLWLLTSLPVITIGASTTAAYYVMTRRISNRENSIASDYFSSFKKGFIKSTIVFLILAFLLSLNLYSVFFIRVPGMMGTVTLSIQLIILIQAFIIYLHIFPLIARFNMPMIRLFKTALVVANKHFPTTLALIAIIAAIVFMCIIMPALVFIAFGIFCWASSYLLVKIYRKYLPDMDNDLNEESDLEQIQSTKKDSENEDK